MSNENPGFQYSLMAPSMDRRRARSAAIGGSLTDVTGVDGRYLGAARRFPGFTYHTWLWDNQMDGSYGDTLGLIRFAEHVSFLKEGEAFHAFVVQGTDSSSNIDTVLLYWTGTAWATEAIVEENDGEVYVATRGGYLYVVVGPDSTDGSYDKKTCYWTATPSFEVVNLGVGSYAAPDAVDSASSTSTNGVLKDGQYLVAYRFLDSGTNCRSGMSETKSITVDNDTETSYISVTLNTTPDPTSTKWDKVEMFRTLSFSVGGLVQPGGALYKAGTFDIEDASGFTYEFGKTTAASEDAKDSKTDTQLVLSSFPENLLTGGVGEPPDPVAMTCYQDLLFMAEADTGLDLAWSRLNADHPEGFPATNRNDAGLPSSPYAFATAGDYLYFFSGGRILRARRVGPQLIFQDVHENLGITNRHAVVGVNSSLVAMTGGGIMVFDGHNGDVRYVSALGDLIHDDWSDSLDDVQAAYDAKLGAVIFLNPTEEEAVLLWTNTNLVTKLEHMNFNYVTSGPDPVNGGPDRAWFFTDGGTFFSVDEDRSETKQTMRGLSETVNTQIASDHSLLALGIGEIDIPGVDTTPNMIGANIVVLSGPLEGFVTEISNVSGSTVTLLTIPEDEEDLRGAYIAIAPIPFRVRFWPLGFRKNEEYPRPFWTRWKTRSFLVGATNFSGASDPDTNANAHFHVGCVRNVAHDGLLGTSAPQTTVDLNSDVTEMVGRVNTSGTVLEPVVEQWSSDLDFELHGIEVLVSLNQSKKQA